MKKTLVRTLLIFLTTTSIIACSKNEETTAPVSIVGKWEFVNIKDKVTKNGQLISDTTITSPYGFWELFSNGTGFETSTKPFLFKYTFSGTTFTIINGDTAVYNNSMLTETTLRVGNLKSWSENGDIYLWDWSSNFKKIQ